MRELSLNVMDIVQNSVRAEATLIEITVAEDKKADSLVIVIKDNGKGIPTELDGRLDKGHGMASMKGRAKQLQGQCLVESGPGYGTVIRLTLPLEQHTTAR